MWIDPESLFTSDTPQDGYVPVFETQCPLTAATEKAVTGVPALVGEIWQQTWVIQPLTDAETAQVAAAQVANLEAEIACRVQQYLDSTAQAHGYDSILTAIGYASEPAVPKFQSDGKACSAGRSLIWAYVYEQLALVKAGTVAQPTADEFMLGIPQLVIPA